MSEANRRPRVVSEAEADTVSNRLEEFSDTFVKVVAGFTVPVKPKYREGHTCTELDARALNWAHVSRAASVANSSVSRGAQKDLSEDEKVAWLTKYIGETYKFTDDLGAEFAMNIVELAADRVVFNLGRDQGHLSGEYADNDSSADKEKRQALVDKILHDEATTEKYTPIVRAEIDTILGETHKIGTRGGTKDNLAAIDLGL